MDELKTLKSSLILVALLCVVQACNKSGSSDTKPPTPVFSANIEGNAYVGLDNFAINFSGRNLFVLQSVASFDTSATAVQTHPAFQFSIYAPLATGTYTFQPPGPNANGAFYSTGTGLDYTFQPDPYLTGAVVGGTLTIDTYDSGRISGSFSGGTINTNLNVNDELLISGKFSNIPVVNR